MAATPIKKIRGMPTDLAAKLSGQGIRNADQLLAAGCTSSARKKLSKRVGIDGKVLLTLLNRADLDRVPGIGAAYAALLEQAGVDSVKELARRSPVNLLAALLEINTRNNTTQRPPTIEQVERWVRLAIELAPVLEY